VHIGHSFGGVLRRYCGHGSASQNPDRSAPRHLTICTTTRACRALDGRAEIRCLARERTRVVVAFDVAAFASVSTAIVATVTTASSTCASAAIASAVPDGEPSRTRRTSADLFLFVGSVRTFFYGFVDVNSSHRKRPRAGPRSRGLRRAFFERSTSPGTSRVGLEAPPTSWRSEGHNLQGLNYNSCPRTP
jgi:hypothetical protein